MVWYAKEVTQITSMNIISRSHASTVSFQAIPCIVLWLELVALPRSAKTNGAMALPTRILPTQSHKLKDLPPWGVLASLPDHTEQEDEAKKFIHGNQKSNALPTGMQHDKEKKELHGCTETQSNKGLPKHLCE